MGALFRGLAHHFDEIGVAIAKVGGAAAVLEFLVVILAVVNAFKGPLILLALVVWRLKWGTISNDVARVGAFCAGVFTLFDWTAWEFSIVRILAALFVGIVFYQGYNHLVRHITEPSAPGQPQV